MFLTMTMAKNKALWNAVTPFLKSGNLTGAMGVTSKSNAAIAQIMTYGLNRVRSARRREDIEQAMEESLMEIMPRLEKRTHYLATFANMSTLAGLLGTIIGLIDAFTAVSNADPADKAELLSASISIGMNCTAFGLMVAIPLVLVHSLLQTKTTEIIDSLEMASVKFLNAITERAAERRPACAGGGGDAPMPSRRPLPSRRVKRPRSLRLFASSEEPRTMQVIGRSARMARHHKRHETAEINLTSMIDMMTILVFFLLVHGGFVRLALLELNLPAAQSAGERAAAELPARDHGARLRDRGRRPHAGAA